MYYETYVQVHHLLSHSVMASFANGLMASGGPGSMKKGAAAAGGSTGLSIKCSLCEEAPGGGGGTTVAGPAHMLNHLGQKHPRQLLQVLHTLHLLTGERHTQHTQHMIMMSFYGSSTQNDEGTPHLSTLLTAIKTHCKRMTPSI